MGNIHLEKSFKGPPATGGKQPPSDGNMEARLLKVEEFVGEAKERLARIETRLDSVDRHMATKSDIADLRADLHKMESTLIKWFVATALALTSATFAIAKFLN